VGEGGMGHPGRLRRDGVNGAGMQAHQSLQDGEILRACAFLPTFASSITRAGHDHPAMPIIYET
ncbi:MAG TPA: hypothetical protein VFB58_02380, partial [Chloroflexota bacterium]|nr:hypothetical protein [Chloroflexota bacterium]